MTTRTDLAALGWPSYVSEAEAIGGFQRGWLLGPALVEDGNDGPLTRTAIAVSMGRLKAGLPTASQHFSFTEFACECDGDNTACRAIWQTRRSIQMCENYRQKLVGPLFIVRGCRCPVQNARVGGAKSSRHLYGDAVDLPVFDVTMQQVINARVGATGVGTYDWQGRRLPRHLDTRDGPSLADPADWDYGDQRSTPIKPNPEAASVPLVPQETDMAMTPAEQEAFAQRVVDKILWAPTFPGATGFGGSSIRNNIGLGASASVQSLDILRAIAKEVGVDEAAIVQGVVATLTPAVTEAVIAAAKAAGTTDPAALARAVVAELGNTLTAQDPAP